MGVAMKEVLTPEGCGNVKRSRKPLWKLHLEIKLKPQPKFLAPRGRVMALYPSRVWDEDRGS